MAETHTSSMIADLLAGLGITGAQTQDHTAQAVTDFVTDRGITARIGTIRWGCLSIEADSINAAKIDWHRDALETVVRKASDERITRVRVRVVPHPIGDGVVS